MYQHYTLFDERLTRLLKWSLTEAMVFSYIKSWADKTEHISETKILFIAEALNLDKRTVIRTIKKLIEYGVLIQVRKGRKNTYKLQIQKIDELISPKIDISSDPKAKEIRDLFENTDWTYHN